jgi:hypothetical protein
MSRRIRLSSNKLNPGVCEWRGEKLSTRTNNISKLCDIYRAGMESDYHYFWIKLKVYIIKLHILHPLNSMKKAQSFANSDWINLTKLQHFSYTQTCPTRPEYKYQYMSPEIFPKNATFTLHLNRPLLGGIHCEKTRPVRASCCCPPCCCMETAYCCCKGTQVVVVVHM